jgi:hypothetical protein
VISRYFKLGKGVTEEQAQRYLNRIILETMTEKDIMNTEKEQVAIDDLVDKYNKAVEEEQKKLSYEASPKAKRKELYALQESKRAPKIQVDQKLVLWAWLFAVGIAFISSAIVSFNGITSVSEFVGLSAPWMASLFFFFIELMYLIFLVAYLVLASRVDEDGEPEKTAGALWGMISFAAIAVAANAFHTLDYWSWDFTNPQMWAGVILSVAAPIAIISASKMASRVVFAKAIKL